jgi:RNA polymerase sigma-70 factor, ECF subfamily
MAALLQSRVSAKSQTNASDNATRWLDAYGDYLYSFAMARVENADLAEELVQETLLGALQSQTAFEQRSSTKTWLVGILKHKIADHYRRSSAASARNSDDATLAAWVDDQFTRHGKWKSKPMSWSRADIDPSAESERQELSQTLSDCLQKLPPQTADIFLLSEQTAASTDKMCNIFGLTTTNIGVILHRARLALRRCLEANWFGQVRGKKR